MDPTSTRMVKFNYIVTLVFIVDFVLTGLIMANYEIFIEEKRNPDFMNNEVLFLLIFCVQMIDVILNFFRTFESKV